MSQENVETVRRIYESWGRGDFREGVDLYHRDVELVLRPEFPDSGVYRGREEIGKYMRNEFLTGFDSASIAGDEFVDGGDQVVVHVDQRAVGPGSRAPVSMRYYQVWTFRDGAVVRIESIREREDALAAAGVRE